MTTIKSALRYLCAIVLIGVSAQAHCAEWDRAMLLYVLGAGVDGRVQVGAFETEINQSFSDIIEHLDVGGMGSFRATDGTWCHTIDAMLIGVSGDETPAPDVRFDADIDQLIASYDIAYRLGEHFDVLAGVRYNSIDVDLAARTPIGTSRASGDKDWFDPYVGLSDTFQFSDAFALTLRADIGGFDIGSELTVQAVVRLDWSLGETFFATLGYRYLATDYEDGSGASFFKYDVKTQGPGVGIGWKFR